MIVSQRSFAKGEITPSIYARCDLSVYPIALRICRNFLIMRHGGATSRPGTKLVAEVKDSSSSTRLIPFQFNNTQTYVLEFGNLYMRIHKNGTPLKNGATIIEVVTPYITTDLFDLQFVQSADVITIVHKSYPPAKISRSSETSWAYTTLNFAPLTSAPTGVYVANNSGTANSSVCKYVITTIDPTTGEESYPSAIVQWGNTPTIGVNNANFIYWQPTSTAAIVYNVYRAAGDNNVFGFLGTARWPGGAVTPGVTITGYRDDGLTPNLNDTPPTNPGLFNSANNYPGVANYIQQRLWFASTNTNPEKVWASRTGAYMNFTGQTPVTDDGTIAFTMAGSEVNEVRHVIDLGQTVVLTSGAEFAAQGDSNGAVTPTEINRKQYGQNGASKLKPIVVGGSAIFVQALGSTIRDLGFEFQTDGYRGNELSIYSAHLVDGFTIIDWCYQKIPHSIVWAVRSDGMLLGMTYIKEQQMVAWHRHDTDGFVESVCSIPEGTEYAVYMIVRRTINGATKRFVERMNTRTVSKIEDYVGMDCTVTVDLRNKDAFHTFQITNGTTWAAGEMLKVITNDGALGNGAYFSSADIGKVIHFTCADGSILRFTITATADLNFAVTGTCSKAVPTELQNVATATWARSANSVSGLTNLEGKKVSVFADGFVLANPNNAAYAVKTVISGAIALDHDYSVITVGLPFICDMQTLDIDTAQGQTTSDKAILVKNVTVQVQDSRSMWLGGKAPTGTDPLQDLREEKLGTDAGPDNPMTLASRKVTTNIKPEWSTGGSVFLRQVDPLPLTVLAISPAGVLPLGR